MNFSTCFAGHLESGSYPTEGVTYKFEMYTGASDKWDPTKSDEPPLASGKAIRIATEFMQTVPLGSEMKCWDMAGVTLKRMSYTGEPEEWLYEVHFEAEPKAGNWTGHVPWMDIPVRLDGTIPKPTITRSK